MKLSLQIASIKVFLVISISLATTIPLAAQPNSTAKERNRSILDSKLGNIRDQRSYTETINNNPVTAKYRKADHFEQPVVYPITNFHHYVLPKKRFPTTDKTKLPPGLQESRSQKPQSSQSIIPRLKGNAPQAVSPSNTSAKTFFLFALAAFWSLIGFMALKWQMDKSTQSPSPASTTSNDSEAGNVQTLNTAQQYMQCAIDQAVQAEAAASRASTGAKDLRLAAAAEAQCHADAARSWAERATELTYSSTSAAQNAAATARNAGYQAQAAADRARYFAETVSC